MQNFSFIQPFLIGCSVAYYLSTAAQLHRQKQPSRLQQMLKYILVFWALSTLKDLVLCLPEVDLEPTLRHIFYIDGFGAVTFAVILLELTRPRIITRRLVAGLTLPFVGFFVLHFLTESAWLDVCYTAFFWAFALIIMGLSLYRELQYARFIHENYSNIERVDIEWVWWICALCTACQLVWYFVSDETEVVGDACYYLLALLCWQFVVSRINRLDTRALPSPTVLSEKSAAQVPASYPFAGRLEQLVETERLYLNQDLTLADLVSHLNTNRTYVSSYFAQVLHTTFYDYINRLRIEQSKRLLATEGDKYTLDYIATQSGFKSLSTFRRAFEKHVGCSVTAFRRQQLSEIES